MIPWGCICVDVVGQYMVNGNNNISYKFMCVIITDLAMCILKIEETHTVVSGDKRGTTKEGFDKKSI